MVNVTLGIEQYTIRKFLDGLNVLVIYEKILTTTLGESDLPSVRVSKISMKMHHLLH